MAKRRKNTGRKATASKSSPRRRGGLRVDLIDRAAAAKTVHSGDAVRITYVPDADDEDVSTQTIVNFLLTAEQRRLDLSQVFVGRDEEDDLVVAIHFPAKGRTRQVKFRVPIRNLLTAKFQKTSGNIIVDTVQRLRLTHGVRGMTDEEHQFLDQALVDFEQLYANFTYAAIPLLANAAALLTRLTLRHQAQPPREDETLPTEEIEERYGFDEYIVNRDQGWPMFRPRFKLHDIVRMPAEHAKRDVEAGYLFPVKAAEENAATWGSEYTGVIAEYRQRRAAEDEATKRRPKATDMEAMLATTEGRKTREEIVRVLSRIIEVLFPAPKGRPPARTAEETQLLVADLFDDFNRRKARYMRRGISKTWIAIVAEMAAEGRYGSRQEALSAASIEKLLPKARKK